MAPVKSEEQKTCFVVMGFGKKTDFETGRVLDLDKSYRNMIKPAVEEAGLKCIRADEIVHSGLIDVPMYEQLLQADVVIADVSTSNKNAYYELGIRHALRPHTTLIICEDGIKSFPFDISHIAVRQYHHLGEDIGFEEVMRFRKHLKESISDILAQEAAQCDSPVYTFLKNLNPPGLADTNNEKTLSANQEKVTADTTEFNIASHSVLMQQVDEAERTGNWVAAKMVLLAIQQMWKDAMKQKKVDATVEMPEIIEDTYLIHRLALATYKCKLPDELSALNQARELLTPLAPAYSNDAETLGLWGAIHKRLYDLVKDVKYLDEAIRAYERGFYIKNDFYNGINFAYLLNVRAAGSTDKAEAITDFVEAKRVRKEVIQICEAWLKDNPEPGNEQVPDELITSYRHTWYWVKASLGEALLGIGDADKSSEVLADAYLKAPENWMKSSTEEQLQKLRPMLEDSPIKYITTDIK